MKYFCKICWNKYVEITEVYKKDGSFYECPHCGLLQVWECCNEDSLKEVASFMEKKLNALKKFFSAGKK